MNAEQAVPAQLRARGLDAADIRLVLMTHMHVDHASAISEFPDSTFVLSKQEWDALADGKSTEGYVKSQYDFGFDYRTFDFESRAPIRSRPSAARSTCSGTAASAPSSRRATRTATRPTCCGYASARC